MENRRLQQGVFCRQPRVEDDDRGSALRRRDQLEGVDLLFGRALQEDPREDVVGSQVVREHAVDSAHESPKLGEREVNEERDVFRRNEVLRGGVAETEELVDTPAPMHRRRRRW